MTDEQPKVEVTDPAKIWPQQPPERAGVYAFIDPAWDVQMVAMTMETWQDVIRDVRTMKARLDQLSAENIEFKQGRRQAAEPSRIITLNPVGRSS